MQSNPNRILILAKLNDRIIGYVDFEVHPNENLAWMGLAVKPELRGQGLGTRILKEFLLSPIAKQYPEIWAGIEPDNQASLRCFQDVGFTSKMTQPDEEGILDYVYRY